MPTDTANLTSPDLAEREAYRSLCHAAGESSEGWDTYPLAVLRAETARIESEQEEERQ